MELRIYVKADLIMDNGLYKEIVNTRLDFPNGSEMSGDQVIRNTTGSAVAVLVPPDEYNRLKSVDDLVHSSDGPAKISGTFVPFDPHMSYEDILKTVFKIKS